MKTVIIAVAIIVGLIGVYKLQEPHLDAYNKHMCAVYGYQEDCKTPLKPADRLK